MLPGWPFVIFVLLPSPSIRADSGSRSISFPSIFWSRTDYHVCILIDCVVYQKKPGLLPGLRRTGTLLCTKCSGHLYGVCMFEVQKTKYERSHPVLQMSEMRRKLLRSR